MRAHERFQVAVVGCCAMCFTSPPQKAPSCLPSASSGRVVYILSCPLHKLAKATQNRNRKVLLCLNWTLVGTFTGYFQHNVSACRKKAASTPLKLVKKKKIKEPGFCGITCWNCWNRARGSQRPSPPCVLFLVWLNWDSPTRKRNSTC